MIHFQTCLNDTAWTLDSPLEVKEALPVRVKWFPRLAQSWSWTAEQSPPLSGSPQATTRLPPQHHKAKADSVDAIWICCATAVRCSPSCTPAACKESIGLVRTRPSARTSFRKPFPKVFWARSFKSPTLESSEGVTEFPQNHSGTLRKNHWRIPGAHPLGHRHSSRPMPPDHGQLGDWRVNRPWESMGQTEPENCSVRMLGQHGQLDGWLDSFLPCHGVSKIGPIIFGQAMLIHVDFLLQIDVMAVFAVAGICLGPQAVWKRRWSIVSLYRWVDWRDIANVFMGESWGFVSPCEPPFDLVLSRQGG